MNDLKATTILAAAFALNLKRWDNDALAALNNGVQSFGAVDPMSIAYQPALDAKFIDDSGRAYDLDALQMASGHEVMRRVEAGTF